MLRALLKPFQSQRPTFEVEQTPFSPDLAKLEEYFFQNVFIYGEMMRGCQKFSQLLEGNCVKMCNGFTHEDKYVMWMKDLGTESKVFALPIMPDQQMGRGSLFGIPAKLLGHVYAMRADQIKKLDEYLMNGVEFKRERIKIEVPYVRKHGRTLGDLEVKIIPAWAYIGNTSYWVEQMDPLNERCRGVKHYSNKHSGLYYFYSEAQEQKRRNKR